MCYTATDINISKMNGYLFYIVGSDTFYRIVAVSISDPKNRLHLDFPALSYGIRWDMSENLFYFCQCGPSFSLIFWFFTIEDFVKEDENKCLKIPSLFLPNCLMEDVKLNILKYHFFFENPKNPKKDKPIMQWFHWDKEKCLMKEKKIKMPLLFEFGEKFIYLDTELVFITGKKVYRISNEFMELNSLFDFSQNDIPHENSNTTIYINHSKTFANEKNELILIYYSNMIKPCIEKGDFKDVFEHKDYLYFFVGNIFSLEYNGNEKKEDHIRFFDPMKFVLGNLSKCKAYTKENTKTHDQKNKLIFTSYSICFMKNEKGQICYVDFIPKKKN